MDTVTSPQASVDPKLCGAETCSEGNCEVPYLSSLRRAGLPLIAVLGNYRGALYELVGRDTLFVVPYAYLAASLNVPLRCPSNKSEHI